MNAVLFHPKSVRGGCQCLHPPRKRGDSSRSGGSFVHSYRGANSSESQRSQTQVAGFPPGSLAEWGLGALTGRGSRPCFGFSSPGIGDLLRRLPVLWASGSPSSACRAEGGMRRVSRQDERQGRLQFTARPARGSTKLRVAAGDPRTPRTAEPPRASLAAAACGVQPGDGCRRACVSTRVSSLRPDDDSAAGDITILISKLSKPRPEVSSRSTEPSRPWSLRTRPVSRRGTVSLCPRAGPPGGDAGHRARVFIQLVNLAGVGAVTPLAPSSLCRVQKRNRPPHVLAGSVTLNIRGQGRRRHGKRVETSPRDARRVGATRQGAGRPRCGWPRPRPRVEGDSALLTPQAS